MLVVWTMKNRSVGSGLPPTTCWHSQKTPARKRASSWGRSRPGLSRPTGSRSTMWVPAQERYPHPGRERHRQCDVHRQVRGSHLRTALLPEENSGGQQAGQGCCRGALSRRGQREEGNEMKIDTEIRHVTKPGANLFLELGFAPDEAKRLQKTQVASKQDKAVAAARYRAVVSARKEMK